jgi:hypothetical protein
VAELAPDPDISDLAAGLPRSAPPRAAVRIGAPPRDAILPDLRGRSAPPPDIRIRGGRDEDEPSGRGSPPPPRLAPIADDLVEATGSGYEEIADMPEAPGAGLKVTFQRGGGPVVAPERASSFGGNTGTGKTPLPPSGRAMRLTDEEDRFEHTPVEPLPAVNTAIVINDEQVQAAYNEAEGYAKRGDLQKAITAFSDALDMRHTLAEAHIGRGRCYLELGDYSSAMSDFQRAEDLNPDKPDPHVAMGDLYYARKEYKRAIEFYDQAVELDGSHAMARCRRGISHYYRKNYRQALQDLSTARRLDPDIPNIAKYVQMAQKKLERGE